MGFGLLFRLVMFVVVYMCWEFVVCFCCEMLCGGFGLVGVRRVVLCTFAGLCL